MTTNSLAIMVYGNANSGRDALTEDKYKELAKAFSLQGFHVESVLYHDEAREKLSGQLPELFDAVLVWVNPIEQGNDRSKLDSLLTEISNRGCFVSTHPEVILKMGTKEVLYKTRDMDWGGDIKIYRSYEDFKKHFVTTLETSGARVLKQYRGNGGNGVYKVVYVSPEKFIITHAKSSGEKRVLSLSDFYQEFQSYFLDNGMLIDQPWNENIVNGMVRCYLSGTKVAGFGYQEINMLYELSKNASQTYAVPSQRYYYTENCGLFADLKEAMENKWVPQLQEILSISTDQMPVIWDADFFINKLNSDSASSKYSLCEINVSCVSPFPPSAIKLIVDNVSNRIRKAL